MISRHRYRTFPVSAPASLDRPTPHTSLVTTVTADYRVGINDVVILANGALTIGLPLEHPRLGQKIIIKNIGTENVSLVKI